MMPDADMTALARELGAVRGVVAVALGGSRARGTSSPDSDVDLGVYVHDDVDRLGLSSVASQWADTPVTVGPAGSWGPWVDSGAWLSVDGVAVDLILRDVARVDRECGRARHGMFAFHSQAGHPFGFLDVSYAGEVALAVPLHDPHGYLSRTAASLTPYPEPLRVAMTDALWQVDFVLDAAAKAASRGDAAYVALCLADAAIRLAHGWHADQRAWATNEKGLVAGVDSLVGAPSDFSSRVAAAVGAIGIDPAHLQQAIAAARALPRPR